MHIHSNSCATQLQAFTCAVGHVKHSLHLPITTQAAINPNPLQQAHQLSIDAQSADQTAVINLSEMDSKLQSLLSVSTYTRVGGIPSATKATSSAWREQVRFTRPFASGCQQCQVGTAAGMAVIFT